LLILCSFFCQGWLLFRWNWISSLTKKDEFNLKKHRCNVAFKSLLLKNSFDVICLTNCLNSKHQYFLFKQWIKQFRFPIQNDHATQQMRYPTTELFSEIHLNEKSTIFWQSYWIVIYNDNLFNNFNFTVCLNTVGTA